MTFFPLFPSPRRRNYDPDQHVCVCIANNLTATVAIPSDIAPGNYVIRHEIIALHSAGQENGAQSYPQCKFFSHHLEISYSSSSSSSKKEKTTNSQLTPTFLFFQSHRSQHRRHRLRLSHSRRHPRHRPVHFHRPRNCHQHLHFARHLRNARSGSVRGSRSGLSFDKHQRRYEA